MDKAGYLPIGKIISAHGVKGDVKSFSYGDTPYAFQPGGLVLLRNKAGQIREYRINRVAPHKKGAILSLNNITDRNQAQKLAGSELLIHKRELPELEEGTYYWFELIGLSVWTTENQFIGTIESIIQTGSNDVYVVNGKNGETLIPGLASVVIEVDLDQQTMRVKLPNGF